MSDETCCGACGYPIHATKKMACDWCRQSADRIEALTKERDRLREVLDETAQILSQCTFETIRVHGQYIDRREAVSRARAALKGESHE